MAYPYTRITNPYQNLQSTAQKNVEVIELPKINDRIKNPNNPQYLNPDSKDYEEIKKNYICSKLIELFR